MWGNRGEPFKRDRVNSIGQETTHQKYKGQNDCGNLTESLACGNLEDESGEKDENQRKFQPYVRDAPSGEELRTCTPGVQVKRQLLKADGIYVPGTVEGIKVEFTADTGAARTILSDRFYLRLPRDKRPELTETMSLVAVNGDALKVMGKAVFKIQLGNLALQREVIVAGIEDECLLGLDILLDSQFGPAVIDLNESRILMSGFEITCSRVSQRTYSYKVPARSGRIIQGMITRSGEEIDLEQQINFKEPNSTKYEIKNAVPVVAALVNNENKVVVPQRALNPSDNDVCLKPDEETGQAELCSEAEFEDLILEETAEKQDLQSVRQIKTGFEAAIPEETSLRLGKYKKKGSSQTLSMVPEQLKEVYMRVVEQEDREDEVEVAVAETHVNHADVFSKDDENLGRANPLELSINTGDSRKLGPPPWEVLLIFKDEETKWNKHLTVCEATEIILNLQEPRVPSDVMSKNADKYRFRETPFWSWRNHMTVINSSIDRVKCV